MTAHYSSRLQHRQIAADAVSSISSSSFISYSAPTSAVASSRRLLFSLDAVIVVVAFVFLSLVVGATSQDGVTVEPEIVTQPINSSGVCVCQPQVRLFVLFCFLMRVVYCSCCCRRSCSCCRCYSCSCCCRAIVSDSMIPIVCCGYIFAKCTASVQQLL